jgi:hypothetical protein
MKLEPITAKDLNSTLMSNNALAVDFAEYFKASIEQAGKFASAPFCWFIPDTKNMKIC